MKVTEDQAAAMVRLREIPEFKIFMGMLGAHAATKNQMLVLNDEIDVSIVRGELRSFAIIQDAIDNAVKIHLKFNEGRIEEYANGTP